MAYPETISATPSGSATLGGSSPTHTGHHDQLKAAIDAIVVELGLTPRGAATTLSDRLAAMDLLTPLTQIADQRILGNVSGTAALAAALTASDVRTMLALVEGSRRASLTQYFREDWTGNSVTGDTGSFGSGNANGGGASITTQHLDAGHTGIMYQVTGANAAGSNIVCQGNFSRIFGGGAYFYETLVMIETLSSGGNTYTYRAGNMDIAFAGSGEPGNGAWYVYNSAVASTWFVKAAQGGVRSFTDTGIAVVAGAWARLGYGINAAGTSLQPAVNGVATGTPITTNIPITSAVNASCRGFDLQKTGGTTGVQVFVDYVEDGTVFTLPR